MKSFFVICFLAIFAVGAGQKINSLKVLSNRTTKATKDAKKIAPEKPVGIGVEEAVLHYSTFPYQVGLIFKTARGIYSCGGALITKQYVLTAAFCANLKEDVTVHLGALNIQKHTDGELIIKVPKSNFIIHKDWTRRNYSNDIALIKLPRPIKLSKKIKPVNLPSRSLSQSKLEGKVVTASGWGQYSYVYSPILHYAHLHVINATKCKSDFHPNVRPTTNICANRGEKKSNCLGKNGDPLVFKEPDGSRTLVGLNSFPSYPRCLLGWPIAFTYIPAYLDWISNHTGLPVRN